MWKLVPEHIPDELKKKYTPEYLDYLASKITISATLKAKEKEKK